MNGKRALWPRFPSFLVRNVIAHPRPKREVWANSSAGQVVSRVGNITPTRLIVQGKTKDPRENHGTGSLPKSRVGMRFRVGKRVKVVGTPYTLGPKGRRGGDPPLNRTRKGGTSQESRVGDIHVRVLAWVSQKVGVFQGHTSHKNRAFRKLFPLFEREGLLMACAFGSLGKGSEDTDWALLMRDASSLLLRTAIASCLGRVRSDVVHLWYVSQMLPFEVIRTGYPLFVGNDESQICLTLATSRSFYDSHPSLFERALVSNGVWSHDLEHNLQILIVEANTHKNFHRGWASFLAPTQEVFLGFSRLALGADEMLTWRCLLL
jgi:hypothetical protein